ncbi:extracellular solute-binding protein [Halomarina litorea]|uniref:extracellular solute-binding protein n=1 Tax=Halomarina litorea TaxID=2961595 RepID=UPI0020C57D3B|nr:extracellular solute-binding protein [Halomarina sp. BCD28]
MSEQRWTTRRRLLKGVGVAGVAGLAGCLGGDGGGNGSGGSNETTDGSGGNETTTMGGDNGSGNGSGGNESQGTAEGDLADSMTVFHAGSLAPPFSTAEPKFEQKYGVQVNREAKGSVGSTKKITEQGRKASVLGVSDFRLLRDMLMPEFGNWYAIFATNAMTIAYTDQSTGSEDIGQDNWWEVLLRDDVSVAHSDPAVDPNGYRSVMTMQLGAIPFQGEQLYDEQTSQNLIEKAQVTSGTETELLAQLQTGSLDYAFEYQSAGATHDVQTVDFQPSVDLSKATQEYAQHYSKAEVQAGGTTFTGAPIAYGITVPSVAPAPGLGARWVEYMITGPGEQILKDSGFEVVQPAVVPQEAKEQVPSRVMENAEARQSLGPLEL